MNHYALLVACTTHTLLNYVLKTIILSGHMFCSRHYKSYQETILNRINWKHTIKDWKDYSLSVDRRIHRSRLASLNPEAPVLPQNLSSSSKSRPCAIVSISNTITTYNRRLGKRVRIQLVFKNKRSNSRTNLFLYVWQSLNYYKLVKLFFIHMFRRTYNYYKFIIHTFYRVHRLRSTKNFIKRTISLRTPSVDSYFHIWW